MIVTPTLVIAVASILLSGYLGLRGLRSAGHSAENQADSLLLARLKEEREANAEKDLTIQRLKADLKSCRQERRDLEAELRPRAKDGRING
jgi:hypothetical protein